MSLLDGKPVNAKFGDEAFDDQAMAHWGSFDVTTVYVDLVGTASSINNLGYKKYCSKVDNSALWGGGWGWCIKNISGWFSNDLHSNSCRWRDGGNYFDVSCSDYGCANYNNGNGYDVSVSCELSGSDVWYKP